MQLEFHDSHALPYLQARAIHDINREFLTKIFVNIFRGSCLNETNDEERQIQKK